MKPPKSLFIGDAIACECYGGKPGEAPYVDVRIDTLPPTDDDTDYSEDPQVLINIAMWLIDAHLWLQWRQSR